MSTVSPTRGFGVAALVAFALIVGLPILHDVTRVPPAPRPLPAVAGDTAGITVTPTGTPTLAPPASDLAKYVLTFTRKWTDMYVPDGHGGLDTLTRQQWRNRLAPFVTPELLAYLDQFDPTFLGVAPCDGPATVTARAASRITLRVGCLNGAAVVTLWRQSDGWLVGGAAVPAMTDPAGPFR